MATFNIELKKESLKDSKEHALMLRITENRKHTRIRLMYSVSEHQFNPKARNANFVRSNHPNHKKINLYLEERINKAKSICDKLESEGKLITAKTIKESFNSTNSKDFLAYMQNHIDSLKSNNKFGSYKKYSAIMNSIKSFHKSDSLLFQGVDRAFLKKYEEHLLKDDKVQNTIAGYTNKIRATFNRAIEDGIISPSDSPFLSYKIKHGVVNKERLDIYQIALIEKLDLPTEQKIHHARNAFIFAFYAAGMRVSDVLMLKWKCISNGKLSYVMIKTKKSHSLTLPKQAMNILNQYDKGEPDDFVFPFMNNRVNLNNPEILHGQIGSKTALVNKLLKEIATKAEIDTNVTFHIARHSFADYARKNSDNLYNLSKTLGHSSLNVTQQYLAAFDQKAVDDTLKQIFNE
jgi:integrase